jgi:exosortase F-associated protein
MKISLKRLLLITVGIGGIIATFLFQEFTFLNRFDLSPTVVFIIKKAGRLLLNDLFMLLIIFAWFNSKSITRLAIVIQLIDAFILLPIYLVFKLSYEGSSEISSPLLSQFHRLIVNPTLMLLLIPAMYFQKSRKAHG